MRIIDKFFYFFHWFICIYEFFQGLTISDFAKSQIDLNSKELEAEKEDANAVLHFKQWLDGRKNENFSECKTISRLWGILCSIGTTVIIDVE